MVDMGGSRGGETLAFNVLPSRDSYEVKFTVDNGSPVLWDLLFGGGQIPRTGLTICTDASQPSVSDLRWASIASRVRYECADLLEQINRAMR